MDKYGITSKTVYNNTKVGIETHIEIRYNLKTDHIMYVPASFRKTSEFGGSTYNKNCPTYLGVTIAEELLAKVFKNVERMPNGNKGFDIICNQGYMIDIKSSTKRKTQNAWSFIIKQNKIADYFLCLAFDNRLNLNPLHVWLIPSEKINHLKTFGISESRLDKWSKYELTDKLDKVIACCNIMKGDD